MSKKIDFDETIDGLKFAYMNDEKKEFLRNIASRGEDKTTKLYIATLKKVVNEAEIKHERNWYEFTEKMVDDALLLIEARTISTVMTYLSIIRDYLSATTPNSNTIIVGYNYTVFVIQKEDLQKYINPIAEQKRYIAQSEFDTIIFDRKGNAQAKAILILLWHGIKGDGFKYIYEMKEEDINLSTGEIYKDGALFATIPMKYMEILNKAINEVEFIEYDNNGEVVSTSQLSPSTGYLLRRNVTHKKDWRDAPDGSLMNRRVGVLQKSIKNEFIDCQSVYISARVLELLEMCNYKMPANKDLTKYKKIHNVKMSYVTAMRVSEILLQKLEKEKLTPEE